MKSKLDRLAPPGINLEFERKLFLWGLLVSLVYSLGFLIKLYNRISQLYHTFANGKRILYDNAVMEDFRGVLGFSLVGFLILAAVLLCLIIYHYAYYSQGSKSVYLMKRLPDGMEMHRRAITLPVLSAALCLAAAFIVLVIYYAIYMAAVPKQCLTPGQWQTLWRF